MSKFDMSKIRGMNKSSEDINNRETRGVGMGLLNDVSKKLASEDMKVIYLERSEIIKNEKNFYSIGNIESLKNSIADVGLRQPLEVLQNDDGTYRLTGGERRLTAIDELIAEGKWNKKIPCVLDDLDKIVLPLDDEQKELYAMITVNREQRDYTDGDTMVEIEKIKEIYKALKEKGVDRYTNPETGEEVSLVGKRGREFVAEHLGISTGQVGKFEKVSSKGSEELKKALLNNELSINTAAVVAELPSDEQKDFIENAKDSLEEGQLIDKYDLLVYHKKKEEEKKKTKKVVAPVEDENNKKQLTVNDWKADTKEILEIIKDSEIMLSPAEYKSYLSSLNKLKKIIKK